MTETIAHIAPEAALSLWRAIIDDMPHMVSIKDTRTRRYLFCNPEAYKVLGRDAIGKTNFELFEQDVATRIEIEESDLISNGGVLIVEGVVTDRQGHCWTTRTKKFLVTLSPDAQYLITISEDVSEKHLQQQRLSEAKSVAETANAAKSSFLATMSHEIRTPLNGVLGMAQAMASEPLSKTQRKRLNVIRDCGQNLLVILNDILDFSKIEAGKLEVEDGIVDVGAIMSSIHDTFVSLANIKGIGLIAECEKSALGQYRGDPVRVRQILYNLVSNGIKFTSQGQVKALLDRRSEGLVITVSDTGIGIPLHRADAMFEKFTQADTHTTRHFGGTGLGLAICRELCQLMGGEITVASELGKGSVFKVVLPLQWIGHSDVDAQPSALASERLNDSFTELQILAAEDNLVNQLVLKTLLRQVGLEPVFVLDGRAAVDAWAQQEWDLILMDVRMPIMDGIEATQVIRSREERSNRRRTPIIALTADALDHQTNSYSDIGMDDFVAKPIDAQNLFDVMDRNIRSSEDD